MAETLYDESSIQAECSRVAILEQHGIKQVRSL